MKLIDFSFETIFLRADGKEFDLHNNFDFIGFFYNVEKREIVFTWRRGRGEWIPKDSPNEIIIEFKWVIHFSAIPRDTELPFTEDDCLAGTLFIDSNFRTDEDRFSNTLDNPDSHIVFQFMSGLMLRVHAEKVYVKLKY